MTKLTSESEKKQRALELKINAMIKKHGVDKAVAIIKLLPSSGMFSQIQNYPNGVMIYCDSEIGGVMVGAKSHGNAGNKNALKREEPADTQIQIRVPTKIKNKMVANAQKQGLGLTDFILSRCLSD